MIIDTNLEQYPTPTFTDSSVTPNPPAAFVPILAPDGLHTYIAGVAGKYTGGLWHIVRSVLPNSGNLSLSFLYNPDAALAQGAQAIEFDLRVTDGSGNVAALDNQFVLTNDKLDWQVSLNGDSWTDTGLGFAIPPAGILTPFTLIGAFNFTAGTYSFGSAVIGSEAESLTEPQFKNLPVLKLNWLPGNQLVFQKQLDCINAAVAFSDVMKNIQAAWS
jgi:hypothetical protein